MSDERALLPDDAATSLADELSIQGEAVDPIDTTRRAGAVHADILKIRWDTPRGRRVRSEVIRSIRCDRSARLGELLHELRGSDEVKGFLDLRYIKLDGENLNGTYLAGLDLTGASFAKTSLVSADLRGACLARARLVGATL